MHTQRIMGAPDEAVSRLRLQRVSRGRCDCPQAEKRDVIAMAVAAARDATSEAQHANAIGVATEALARYPGEAELIEAQEKATRGKEEVRSRCPLTGPQAGSWRRLAARAREASFHALCWHTIHCLIMGWQCGAGELTV